ncbi:hypothetical protein SISNIDRAFT_472490 [Sistotremastrum niveocremeum HHB9708]|uniref:DNA topoisomerase I n=1 Tax=Sistotremastrum niveocremeum HHB9708 TaxID=1314777 RepID=A0A165A9U5_9AGAM|nr:hypothetical protein SISNIDRAFT_472490 [Sistotremastrum niveocremeum HHB9708]
METSENDGEISTPKPKAKSSKATNGTKKSKAEANGSPKKASKEEEEEDTYKWWEQQQQDEQDAADALGDGSVKWKTLQHNGVLFPPPYQPLPDHVKLHYNGKPVSLPPAAEEVAGFFAAMLATDHARDSVFQENFFKDFLRVLKDAPPKDGTVIETFESCDFRKMYDHFESEKAKKQGMTSAQKKELKEAQNQVEEKYKTCLLDGRKEKVGNFRVEPPGLFRGRGDHPKKGALKNRLRPEDIVINIGENEEIPVPNVPGTWKKVVHDNTVTWLANWKENINGNFKYVFLAASSSLKGQSDMNKFEKARELKKHVDRIRKDYSQDLRAKVMADRQRATAMYFIDKLALRAGNEKGEDEADTVGCCSLRCEHVTADPPDKLIFDFLGKDSIRYYNNVPVDPQVFKNVRIFKEGKDHDDSLFDRVTTGALNKHLASYMPGLTAKVFRTYNASITLQQQLDDHTPADGTVMEKLAAYNKANRMVAILCNHQRSVAKGHGDSMQKMADKLKGLKYDRMKLRHALFALDAKYRKKKAFSELESDLDEEWIESWEDRLRDKDIEKAEKKFIKDNEKLTAEGKETLEESVLKDRIKDIRQEHARLVKERGTDKAELKRSKPAEKIEEAIESLDQKIKNFKLQMEDKEEGKEVSLGTSKINYLDPRITSAWCAKHDVPITKIFSKALVQKCGHQTLFFLPWAMSSDPDWKF